MRTLYARRDQEHTSFDALAAPGGEFFVEVAGDVVVDAEVDLTGPLYNASVKHYLTPATRRIVKSIKEQLVHSSHYRKSRWQFTDRKQYFGAHDIYKAVFGCGVTNVVEFADYLKNRRGIDISADVRHEANSLCSSFSIIVS